MSSTLKPTTRDLFLGFLGLGLIGFGGVLPMARRMVVEQRSWLTAEAFAELLGICQFLPGGNIINLAVAIGLEFRGIRGALAALIGLLAAPTVIVVCLGMIYDRYQNNLYLQHVFAGLAAAAAGLLISTALKMLLTVRTRVGSLIIVAAFFCAVALFRLPLLPVMLGLLPLSIFTAWRFG